MSTTQVEERVIGLRFDNKDFEKNVKSSINVLDKLQYTILGLRSGASNILLFASSLRNITFTPIANGIQSSIGKLMALTAALTGVGNVATDVYHKMTALVQSMGIGQQGAVGWQKYADYTESIQTIMAATRKEEESEEDALERVNEQLERLLWFTDETSYNLTDMTSNIGKFTSQGVDLEDAVVAMQGIALWSAKAGQGTQQASRAMYNLSQSLGMGAVRLQDWMSIENANMATKEFKELAIQAGLAEGTLKKVGDEIQTIGGEAVTFQNFRDTLSENWLSTDTLMRVLKQYGDFANKVRELQEEKGILASEAIEILKAETLSAEDEFGLAAFEAGQAAITFKQAIDSVGDAVSTNFMRIYQAIFGNFLEAKELWTDFSEELWNIFAGPVSTVADVLERFDELGGTNKLLNQFWRIWNSIADVVTAVKETILEAFGLAELSEKGFIDTLAFKLIKIGEVIHGWVNEFTFFVNGILDRDDIWANLTNFFEGLISAFNVIKKFVSDVLGRFVNPAVKQSNDIFAILTGVLSKMGDIFKFIEEYVEETDLFNSIFDNIAEVVDKVAESLKKIKVTILSTLEKFSKNPLIQSASKKIAGDLPDRLTAFGDTAERTANIADIAGDVIVDAIDKVTDAITVSIPWFIRFWQFIERVFTEGKEIFGYIKHYGNLLVDAIKQVFGMLNKTTGEMIDSFNKNFSFGDLLDATPIANFIKSIVSSLGMMVGDTVQYYNTLYESKGAVTMYQKIMYTIADIILQSMNAFEPVLAKLAGWFGAKNLTELMPSLFEAVLMVIGVVKLIQLLFAKQNADMQEARNEVVQSNVWWLELIKLPSSIAALLSSFQKIVDPFKDYAKMIATAFKQLFIISMAVAIIQAIGIMALATFALSLLPWNKLLITAGIIIPSFAGIIIGTIFVLSSMIKSFEKKGYIQMEKKLLRMSVFIYAIGITFLMMAAALGILVLLPWDSTNWSAVQVGIAVMMGTLFGAVALLARIASISNNEENQMFAMAAISVALAASVLIIAIAMKKISKIDPERLTASAVVVMAVLGLIAIIQFVATAADKYNSEDVYYALGISSIMMASAVMISAFALSKIAEIDQGKLKSSGIAMGIIFLAISAFIAGLTGLSKLITSGEDSTKQFAMLMVLTGIMCIVVLAIATALAKIASTNATSKKVLEEAGAISLMIAVIGGVIIGMTMLVEKLNQGQVRTMMAVTGSLASMIATVALLAYAMGKVSETIDVNKLWALVGALTVMILVIGLVVFALTFIFTKVAESSSKGAMVVGILALVGGIIATILLAIGLIVFGVGLVLKSFVDLANLSDKAATQLQHVMSILAGAISGVIAEIFDGIDEGLSKMFGIEGKLGPTIVEFVLNIFMTIIDKLSNSGILGKLKVFLTKLAHTIGAFVKDNHEIITETLSIMINDILFLLETHGPKFLEILDKLLTQMADNLNNLLAIRGTMLLMTFNTLLAILFKILKETRNNLMDLVFGTIDLFLIRLGISALGFGLAAGNIVFAFIDGLLLAINERAPILMEELALTVINLINALADTIDNNADELIKAIERLLDSLYNAFTKWIAAEVKIGGKLYSIGSNIVIGVINGIRSKIPFLNGIISNIANSSIVKTFCDKLGINSPSTVFKGFGENIDQGLGIGITDGIGTIKDKVSELAKLIIGDFASSFGDPKSIISGFMSGLAEGLMGDITSKFNINDLMGEFSNLNPVITPELDLSNIEGGAAKISDLINPDDIDLVSENFTRPSNGMDAVTMQNGLDAMMKKMQNYIDVQNYNNNKPKDNVTVVLDGDAKKMLKVVKVENNKQYKATGVDQLAHA